MSWSTSLGGHAVGSTPVQQKTVEENIKEILDEAFDKLKNLEHHDFTPPVVWFQHLGQVDFNAPQSAEGSDE